MEEMIVQMVNAFGYIGIIVLIALENIFPPIPSEVILTFGGFMTTYTQQNIWGVIFAATIGSVIGAIVLYFVGKLLNRERLLKLIDGKPGKWLHFKREDVILALDWFSQKGTKAVFFCRCIPIMRSLISIPAGMSGMPVGMFLAMTVAGTMVWNIVLVHLGAFAGESWGIITKYMDTYKNWVIIVLAVLVFVVVFLFHRKKKYRSAE